MGIFVKGIHRPRGNEVEVEVGSPSGVQLLVRPFTPAELMALTDDDPVEVLPGIAGSAYAMIDTGFSFRVGDTQYTDGADLFFSLGPPANGWSIQSAYASDIIGAANALTLGGFGTTGWGGFQGAHLDPTEFDAQPIKVFLNPNDAPNIPFGGEGDGILSLYLQYTLTPL